MKLPSWLQRLLPATKYDTEKILTNQNELALLLRGLGKKKTAHFNIAIAQPKNKLKENIMIETTITNEQKVNVTLTPVTDTGKPAKLDGAPKWTVVSGDSTVIVAPDGMSADLVSSDTPGDTTFLVDGDADLGAGVEDIQETITLHVAGARAKNLGVKIGTPVAKDGVA